MPFALALPAALPVVIAGVFVVLFLYANRDTLQTLVGSLSGSPLSAFSGVGVLIGKAADAITSAMQTAITWAAHPVVAFLWTPLAAFETVAEDLGAVAGQTLNAVSRIRWGVIPELAASTSYWILYWAQQVTGTAAGMVAGAVSQVESEIRAVQAWTLGLIGAGVAQVESEVRAAQAQAAADLHQAVAGVEGEIRQAQDWTQQLVGQAVAGVEGEIRQAQQWTQALVGQAEQVMGAALGAGVSALEQAVASEQSRAQSAEAAIAGSAAAATAAVAQDVAAWRQRCGDPLCTNLNGFGHDLAGLFGFVEGGLLLAFAAACAADARGMARLVDGVGSPVVRPAAQAAASGAGVTVGAA